MPAKTRDVTVSMFQANLFSLPIIFLIVFGFSAIYLHLWGKGHLLEGFRFARSWLFYLILISGFILHEIIHLAGYHLLGKVSLKFIKIGFQLKTITPYAYCGKPMALSAYRLSALLPGLILGFIPGLFSIFTGNSTVFIFAIFFSIAAGGDFLLIWLLRKIPAESLVQDHPEKAGCIILESN